MRLRGRRLGLLRARLIVIGLRVLLPIYRVVPPRLTFVLLTLWVQAKLPGAAVVLRPFVPIAALRELRRPDLRLTSWVSRFLGNATSQVLFGVEAYRQCLEWTLSRSDRALPPAVYDAWIRSLIELGRFAEARDVLAIQPKLSNSPPFSQLAGHLDLIAGQVASGVEHLGRAITFSPDLLRPHQNLADRASGRYVPTLQDLACGPDGWLYDAFNYIGQRVTHVGEGQLSPLFYGEALAAQDRLRRAGMPALSPALSERLERWGIAPTELRLLPTEWFTQIGHQGMLDMLFRMRDFGWWSGKAVFLMTPSLVANASFQSLFDDKGAVFLTDADRKLTAELLSLQRWCGLNFNAFRLPSGEVVPWQEAGAKLMLEWDRAGRGDPPAQAFDARFGRNTAFEAVFQTWRRKVGLKPDDWFVCLHMRDASHYGEVAGTGQTHRNTSAASYVEAIRYITSRGGWVVKLGGQRSPKLPQMPRLIDYARSGSRSELMDVALIRHGRFFIGTTSGLTNVAVSFGRPCALVNCITTDAQLWSDRVRFALKRIRLRDGRELSQHELTTTPWRWRVFGADVLARHGAVLLENSADEILGVVKDVEALADGRTGAFMADFPDAATLLEAWRDSLAFPHFYGAAQPSLYVLDKHRRTLLPGLNGVSGAGGPTVDIAGGRPYGPRALAGAR